jgi:transposase
MSPYDTDARFSVRRSVKWEGYRLHVTETCDEDRPLLITNVQTTTSASLDLEWTDAIHRRLQERELLPKVHLVDGGYVDARALAEGESIYGLDLVGPTKLDPSWQARRAEMYGLSRFVIDWEKEQAICPQGRPSQGWYPGQNPYGEPFITAQWPTAVCRACPTRAQCVRTAKTPRAIKFHPKERYLALQKARQRQTTDEFKEVYKQRAGVEGTISQGTQVCGLRRCRYRGTDKTHLQHVFTAVAINLKRLAAWFEETPRSQTRLSRFAALAVAT